MDVIKKLNLEIVLFYEYFKQILKTGHTTISTKIKSKFYTKSKNIKNINFYQF